MTTQEYWRKRCLAAEAVLLFLANKRNSTVYAQGHIKKWNKWDELKNLKYGQLKNYKEKK